jgi:hypothetical protein
MTLNGSSGSGGGFRQFWQKNGAVKWQVGFANSMLGTGTSDDFKIMDQASGNAITIASGSGNINVTSAAASTSASTGALTVAGGIGCGGAITGAGIGVGQPFGAAGANINAIAGVNAGGYIMGIQNLHGAVGDAALLIGAGSGTATDAGSVLIDFRSPNYGVICGTIARNGTQSVAYNTSSDLRGKPNREPLSLDYARSIVDALKIWDFDKDGNAIRGLGVIAQEAYAVHKSLAQPGLKPETWWQAEKAAPVPFLVANMQQLNRRIDQLEAEIAELKLQRK